MALTRREFGKLSAAIAILPSILLTGCADAVIAALDVAGAVAKSAAGILASVSPRLNAVLLTVAADIAKVITAYKDYEATDAQAKPGKFSEIQTILTTITDNLAEILQVAHLQNLFHGNLIVIIKTAVAIVNTAISLIISHLPAQHKAAMQAKRLELPPLPIIDGAKNANDLKATWNQAVKAEHPEAVIQ